MHSISTYDGSYVNATIYRIKVTGKSRSKQIKSNIIHTDPLTLVMSQSHGYVLSCNKFKLEQQARVNANQHKEYNGK